MKAWAAANRDKTRAANQRWRDNHPGGQSLQDKKSYSKHRAARLAKDKLDRETNLEKFLEREQRNYKKNRAKRKLKEQRWRAANRDRVALYAANRRNAKDQRTPLWLTDEQHNQILLFYIMARVMTDLTGVMHHIDHIVPLRGKIISGLHVPWNLQILQRTANLKKQNKFDAA